MALACPACRSDMDEVDFMGVRLDVCPECAGIWFDDGELRLLSKSSPDAMEKLEEMYSPEFEVVLPAPVHKQCPRGHGVMETFRYLYDSPVEIDSCPECGGVFVEEKELAGMAIAIEHKYRSHLSSTMEARARLSGRPTTVRTDRDTEANISALITALAHWRDHANTEA